MIEDIWNYVVIQKYEITQNVYQTLQNSQLITTLHTLGILLMRFMR